MLALRAPLAVSLKHYDNGIRGRFVPNRIFVIPVGGTFLMDPQDPAFASSAHADDRRGGSS